MIAQILAPKPLGQILCALVFIVNFMLTAYFGKRTRDRAGRREIYRTSFNRNRAAIIALILNIALLLNIVFAPFRLHFSLPVPIILFVGLIGIASNVLLALALKELGANYQPYAQARKPAYVVTTGPYRLFRHPIYVTNRTQFGAMLFLIPSVVSVALFIVLNVQYYRTSRDEERCNDELLKLSEISPT